MELKFVSWFVFFALLASCNGRVVTLFDYCNTDYSVPNDDITHFEMRNSDLQFSLTLTYSCVICFSAAGDDSKHDGGDDEDSELDSHEDEDIALYYEFKRFETHEDSDVEMDMYERRHGRRSNNHGSYRRRHRRSEEESSEEEFSGPILNQVTRSDGDLCLNLTFMTHTPFLIQFDIYTEKYSGINVGAVTGILFACLVPALIFVIILAICCCSSKSTPGKVVHETNKIKMEPAVFTGVWETEKKPYPVQEWVPPPPYQPDAPKAPFPMEPQKPPASTSPDQPLSVAFPTSADPPPTYFA